MKSACNNRKGNAEERRNIAEGRVSAGIFIAMLNGYGSVKVLKIVVVF